jgi:hypothetical protein
MSVGVDVGTNRLVSASLSTSGEPVIKTQRDAFFRIEPKSDVNSRAIKMSLEKSGSSYVLDGKGNFNVVGEDALQIALDRNQASSRPMQKGVISPEDKDNMPMLKLLLEGLVGKGSGKLVYSVPAAPIEEDFDIEYHTTLLNMFFSELGYSATPINEAFAIGLNELIDTGLTGICFSAGAGMGNIALIAQGDPIVTFSTTRSGDYIDKQVGKALAMSASLVQLEKESGVDLFNPSNKIMEAIAIYYKSVIKYTVDNIAYEIKKRKANIPVFREAVPIVLSGGLAWAQGYKEVFESELQSRDFPFEIGEVKVVSNPDTCVALGCLLASQL